MARERICFVTWLRFVIAWDGILPICVALFPIAIRLVLPNVRDAIAITSVAVPVAALVIRIFVGNRHIARNRCGSLVRAVQYCFFLVGILSLMCVECIFMAVGLNALLANEKDRYFTALAFGFYLVAMTIAMYPGRIAEIRDAMDERPIVPS